VSEREQGRFKPGVSGNPKGRPRKAVTELNRALRKHGAELADKLIALALDGDTTALKICIDRIHAPLKPQSAPVELELPEGAGLAEQGREIVAAVGRGELAQTWGHSCLMAPALLPVHYVSEVSPDNKA